MKATSQRHVGSQNETNASMKGGIEYLDPQPQENDEDDNRNIINNRISGNNRYNNTQILTRFQNRHACNGRLSGNSQNYFQIDGGNFGSCVNLAAWNTESGAIKLKRWTCLDNVGRMLEFNHNIFNDNYR